MHTQQLSAQRCVWRICPPQHCLQISSAAGEAVQLLPEPVQDVLAKLREPLAKAFSAVRLKLRVEGLGETRPPGHLATECQAATQCAILVPCMRSSDAVMQTWVPSGAEGWLSTAPCCHTAAAAVWQYTALPCAGLLSHRQP